jgi:hypothetical protein
MSYFFLKREPTCQMLSYGFVTIDTCFPSSENHYVIHDQISCTIMPHCIRASHISKIQAIHVLLYQDLRGAASLHRALEVLVRNNLTIAVAPCAVLS